jgi:uncharacterized membrane protein YidH (DUF202 family)
MTQSAMFGRPDALSVRRRLGGIGRFLFGSLAGRLLVGGAALKAITLTLGAAGAGAARGVQALSTLGGVALVAGAGILAVRLWRRARTQLLWRVRRKLIISYVFIGVVPAILIVTFFFLSGLLLFANLSSFLIRSALTDLADEASAVARLAAADLESRGSAATIRSVLRRRARSARCRLTRAAAGARKPRGRPARLRPQSRPVLGSMSGPRSSCRRGSRATASRAFWRSASRRQRLAARALTPRVRPGCSCGRWCSRPDPTAWRSWRTCR